MEGGFGGFPFGGDPEDLLRGLREFAEQQAESVQEAQREQFATLTLNTAVELTAAALQQVNVAGGDLDELRSQLAALRVTENPPGIEEAEEASLELQHVIGAPPMLATPARLDEIGSATRKLEVALGSAMHGSPFAAMGPWVVFTAMTSFLLGTWDRLEETVARRLEEAREHRRAAERVAKARRNLKAAEREERDAAERARRAAEELAAVRDDRLSGPVKPDGEPEVTAD